MLSEQEKLIVQFVLQQVFKDDNLSRPRYCTEVKSECDANRLSDALPLIYIWNEDRIKGTFSISVNGGLLEFLLEAVVPRSSASFNKIRDEAISVISNASQTSVVSTCEKLGAFASDIFYG